MKSKKTILWADDDGDDLQMMREILTKNNEQSRIIEVGNGKEALRYLRNCGDEDLPCLIILDINMPVMDGKETLSNIKRDVRLASIPVVVFTTSKLENDRKSCYELGANCFISKPSGYHEVLDVTRSIALLWCLK